MLKATCILFYLQGICSELKEKKMVWSKSAGSLPLPVLMYTM